MKYASLVLVALLGLIGGTNAQEQVRSVSGFNNIGNAGSFAVHIKVNGTESLKIDGADAEELSMIETNVTNGHLEIRWKRGSEPHHYNGRIDVYVTAKSLSGLKNAGSGSMDVDGTLNGGDVEVQIAGSGNISTAVNASQLVVSIAGSGSIKLTGKAGNTKVEIAGSGRLNADGLATDVADVQVSGSGDTYIKVNKTISASIVGSGSVHYSGAGTVSSVRTVGSGRLSKVG